MVPIRLFLAFYLLIHLCIAQLWGGPPAPTTIYSDRPIAVTGCYKCEITLEGAYKTEVQENYSPTYEDIPGGAFTGAAVPLPSIPYPAPQVRRPSS